MSEGVPFMCIITTGTCLSRTRSAMRSSILKPLMSFTMSAPASNAASATSALVVSMDIGQDTDFLTAFMTGKTRLSSWLAETGLEKGLVDSPPISIIWAPQRTRWSACSRAFSGWRNLPPSEKESGVTLSTPIMMVLLSQ